MQFSSDIPASDIEADPQASTGEDSEHIYLESAEESPPSPPPQTISTQLELNDLAHGRKTVLTLFEEGWLRLREHRRGKLVRQHELELRHVDPTPLRERYVARRTLHVTLGLLGASLLGALLAQFDVLRPFALPGAIVTATAAVVALLLFVYRTREQTIFVTQHGRAGVLRLAAGFGCLRRCRALVPMLAQAIRDASLEQRAANKAAGLRAEMREHYRLLEADVISREECSAATGRILARFD